MACICFVLLMGLVSILYTDACPEACRVCTSDGVCRECEYGWFGKQCDQKCLASAKICSFCKFNVLVKESVCLRCPKGQYSAEGKCWDCFTFCDSCIDYMMCTECKIGYYGSDCFHPCPNNCVGCLSKESCMSCKEGWFGKDCQCSQNCVQVGEINDWCSINGTCLNGCVAGKHGDQCTSDCPNIGTCLQCNQFNGQCLKCSNGLYGRLCDKICGHCQSDSKGVVVCDTDTGNCPYACANGFYGSNCNQECSGNCLDSVVNTNLSTCDKTSGLCNFGCIPGRYGGICEYNCSDTCRRDSCDSKTAQCLSRSDQNEPSNNLFTTVGCLIGSFIILFSAVTIWFIKRRVCSGKYFSSKCNSEVSFPVTTAPFSDGDSEELGNTVEIYHHIIDTDHAHQTGSGSSSSYYDEVQSDHQGDSSSNVATVTNSVHLTNLRSVLTSETGVHDRNGIFVTDYDIPITRSETFRRHQCGNYDSPLADQHNDLSHALEKQTLSKTKQCKTIQGISLLNTHCHCFPVKRNTSRNTAHLQTEERVEHDSHNILENADGNYSNASTGCCLIDKTFQTENTCISRICMSVSENCASTCHSVRNNPTHKACSNILCKTTMFSDTIVNSLNKKHEDSTEMQVENEHFKDERDAVYIHPVH